MATNLLKAILNITKTRKYSIAENYIGKKNIATVNRANNVGEALELFVKDAFCGSFDEKEKTNMYSKNFSYLGNQNNPPDIIIRGGDAIEVKKIAGVKKSDLALNSSYPKSKLLSSSKMITDACRKCEPDWKEKDIVYSVGFVEGISLKAIVFVYGDCYAASPETYERVREKFIVGLSKTDMDFSKTNELGRINKVDPLGITNLRIRGMWAIQNPLKAFSILLNVEKENKFTLVALMRKAKYLSFPKEDRDCIENNRNLKISDAEIPEPDNPAKLASVKIIMFTEK